MDVSRFHKKLNFDEEKMDIELTKNSIVALCNNIDVPQPVVQLLSYEAMEEKNDETKYRLLLSDGLHMNSYFFVSHYFGDLVANKQIKYGSLLRLEKYTFIDGENVTNYKERLIIFIEEITILFQSDILGEPRPFVFPEEEKIPLKNLNETLCVTRNFYNFIELRCNLISIRDLYSMPDGKCSFILKLTVNCKHPIISNNTGKVLNITMTDPIGSSINVSACNLVADKMNEIFEINKKYYITDFIFKHDIIELQFQADSVVIECIDEPNDENNFSALLNKNVNTLTDIIGVCYDIVQIEKVNTSFQNTDATLNISLIDKQMKTITLKIFGENVKKFARHFNEPPVVMIKQAILKEFNGIKFLSMDTFSELTVNPTTKIALELKEWYHNHLHSPYKKKAFSLITTFNFK